MDVHMNRIESGSTQGLADTASFVRTLGLLRAGASSSLPDLFDPAGELFVARAPGRLDLMGGIADYSGSLVLELPIASATHAALQLAPEQTLLVVSLPSND